jgi:hypothetical protein
MAVRTTYHDELDAAGTALPALQGPATCASSTRPLPASAAASAAVAAEGP